MRKLTGSQRKAKKKLRAMSRTPKGKRQSGYITLYHGTRRLDAPNAIRHEGLLTYSPSHPKYGVTNVLTTDKQFAKKYAQYKTVASKRPHNKLARKTGYWSSHILDGSPFGIKRKRKVFMKTVVNPKSIITVKIPRKQVHKYLLHGKNEEWSNPRANQYGIRKQKGKVFSTIPRKYIK